ncbi:MAG: response regulator [Desulfobacterales bacterium]|nr:response regulator [Desulfobacterales bacterium]
MSVVRIFSGVFCQETELVEILKKDISFNLISDEMVVEKASRLSGLKARQIQRAFATSSVFNSFTFEKERAIAYLKLALATLLNEENALVTGYTGLLIPGHVSHVLKVCLVADAESRIQRAAEHCGQDRETAYARINQGDQSQSDWTRTLFNEESPWEPDHHDMVIPTDKTQIAQAAALITSNLAKAALSPTEESRQAVADFLLSATVETRLLDVGHHVDVSVENGKVTLGINRQVLMGNRLEEELRQIVAPIPGINRIDIQNKARHQEEQTYRKHNLDMPSRVLLVDDEREFVQTLSERLQMREMDSAVAYDGMSALDLVESDDPEVMIIDLKMPEIDGMEVLKKVKQRRPEIEVIVLTGHGSEQDRQDCMDLGAFAYLQKPVDIDVLSDTLKRAYDKTRIEPGR